MKTLIKALFLTALCVFTQESRAQITLSYWFDDNQPEEMTLPAGKGAFTLDASGLTAGFHSVTAMAKSADGLLSSAHSALFVKTLNPLARPDMKALVVTDGKTSSLIPVTPHFSGAAYSLDMTALPIGVHTLATALVTPEGEMTDYAEAVFLRVATRAENETMKAYYLVDDDPQKSGVAVINGPLPTCRLDIDMASLSTGLHTITVYLASALGPATMPVKSFFIRIPDGGEGIHSYQYWIDNRSSERVSVKLERPEIPLQIVTMVDVPEAAFRSSKFELKDDPDGLHAYGIHDFNFVCFDGDNRATSGSHEYVESRRRVAVDEITPLQPAARTVHTGEIAPEKIKWYSVGMLTGDSLEVRTSTAACIDIFSPSRERRYRVSGSESTHFGGIHAHEDGDYIIAVHDIAGSRKETSLTWNHYDKYAIISHSPKRTAAADMFVLTISGNGLDNLKNATLVSGETVIAATCVRNDGHSIAYCTFDLTGAPNGDYDICASYDNGEEPGEVTVTGGVRIDDPRPGEIRVSAARSVFGTTLNDVLIRITNTGNVPYWGVPFSIASEADGSQPVKINFKDFNPNMPEDGPEDWTMYITGDLLATGRRGGYLPMVLPYIGPHETKELTIVYQMPLRVHIPTYAWAGKPWSEEFRELRELAEKGLPFPPVENRNYISAQVMHLAQCAAHINGYAGHQQQGMTKAPGRYVDISGINNAVDLATEIGEATGHDMSALNNAGTVTRNAVGLGNTMGGIVTGLRLRNLDAQLSAAGIDLSTGEYESLANYRNDLIQTMPDPARIARDTWGDLAGDIVEAMLGLNGGCSETSEPMPAAADIVQMTSCDPNDITGYQSPSGDRHVGIGVTTLPYTIEFENDPQLATAPAHVIRITDRLDPDVFDLGTFAMREVKIGDKSLRLDGGADFVRTIDMRPDINAIAEVGMTLDKASGNAEWTIRTLDPMTLEPATEMIQGVLPVNDGGNGCGEIQFDIDLRQGLDNGLKFGNKATIVFDKNDPIETPLWENVTDYTLPEARITGMTKNGGIYEFTMETSDTGAGVWTYELYYRASGSNDWKLLRGGIPADTGWYESARDLDGSFCMLMTDGAGNRQTNTPLAALMGDADGNGTVDSNDVVVIRNYFTSKAQSINKIAADITLDYLIDAQDAISTRNVFLNRAQHVRARKYPARK